MVKAETISRFPLFLGLPEAHLRDLANIAVERRYARGVTIFAEGEPAGGFHIVTEGTVKIYKLSTGGKEQILHVWGPGEPFGEVAVFQGRGFPANAAATADCRTVFIPRSELIGLIRVSPELALALLGVFSTRMRGLTSLVETISLKAVHCRLAAYLVALEESGRRESIVQLSLGRAELASYLGTIPETLSRALSRLAKEGLISVEPRRRIKIIDRPALAEVGAGRRQFG